MKKNNEIGEAFEPAEPWDLLAKITDHVSKMQVALDLLAARSIAQQAAIHALISTHPDPSALFDHYAAKLDAVAGVDSISAKDSYREELHHFQTLILQTVNLQKMRP